MILAGFFQIFILNDLHKIYIFAQEILKRKERKYEQIPCVIREQHVSYLCVCVCLFV